MTKLIALTLAFFSFSVSSALIDIDISSTISGYKDTETGLEWVDLSETINITNDELRVRLSSDLKGFKLAFHEEVTQLIERYFVGIFDYSYLHSTDGLIDVDGNPAELTDKNVHSVFDNWSVSGKSGQPRFIDLLRLVDVMGGNIQKTEISVRPTFTTATLDGAFASKYNNFGYTDISFAELFDYDFEMSPGVYEPQKGFDALSVFYWDGATIAYLDGSEGISNFSKAGYYLNRVASIPEPNSLGIFGLTLLVMVRIASRN